MESIECHSFKILGYGLDGFYGSYISEYGVYTIST